MFNGSAIGNLGNDPELKYSANGAAFLRFNIATNSRRRAEDGTWGDHTEWLRCTVFGQRAETLSEYLKKGTRVFVYGRLEAKPWTAQDGTIRAGLELLADTVEFMSARNEDGQQQPSRRERHGGDDDLPF